MKYGETSGSKISLSYVFLFFFFLKDENTYKLENLLMPPGDLAKGFLFIDCSAYKLRTNQAACRQHVAQAAGGGQSQMLGPALSNGLGTFMSCNYLAMQMKEGELPSCLRGLGKLLGQGQTYLHP